MHGSLTSSGSRFGFWAFHSSLSALPGFILAWRSGNGSDPVSAIAMLLAIATFIFVFTALSSSWPELSDPRSFASTTLRIVCNNRSAFAVISVPFALHNDLFMLLPDTWCGAIAVMTINIPGAGIHAFLETYLRSIAVGAMLSAAILAIYTACLLTRAGLARLASK